MNSEQKVKVTACGILFFSYNNGKLHFLLGRETKDGKYADFGGKREKHESIKSCAIREAYEEEEVTIFSIR